MVTKLFFKLLISGPVCWKNKKLSYGRGVGTIPSSCPSDRPDKWGGLCYKRCRDGYRPFGCCLCKRGWRSYPRGAGVVPKSCPSSKPDKHVGLCYKKCRTEYKGVSSMWKLNNDWHENRQLGEKRKIRTEFLLWLRSSVVRASDRQLDNLL